MSESQTQDLVPFQPAEFRRRGGAVEARLRLMLENNLHEVWSALTQPEALLQWLAPGEIEPRLGGDAKLNFIDSGIVIDSTVTAYEPQAVLEYSWSGPGEPARPLRWELEPVGAAVLLTLTLTVPLEDDAGRSAAGFAAHLDMLAAALAGVPIKFPFEVFKAARDAYRVQVAELGAG